MVNEQGAFLADRAIALKKRGDALKTAPLLSRMSGAQALADEMACLFCEMAGRVDALTMKQANLHEGGGDKPLKTFDGGTPDFSEGEGEQ